MCVASVLSCVFTRDTDIALVPRFRLFSHELPFEFTARLRGIEKALYLLP